MINPRLPKHIQTPCSLPRNYTNESHFVDQNAIRLYNSWGVVTHFWCAHEQDNSNAYHKVRLFIRRFLSKINNFFRWWFGTIPEHPLLIRRYIQIIDENLHEIYETRWDLPWHILSVMASQITGNSNENTTAPKLVARYLWPWTYRIISSCSAFQ